MPSVPPPSSGSPQEPAGQPAPELVLSLEGPGSEDALRLGADGIAIMHGRVMRARLELPLGAIKVAAVDPGPARGDGQFGRFAVLRQIGPTTVIPRNQGIEGWLWTSSGGTALTNLGPENDAPNVALLFAKPLDEPVLREAFEPEFVRALGARSPLGSPTVAGVLFRVTDTLSTERAFKRWGFQAVLTDKQVPPPLRRHLPTDRPADPVVRGDGEDPRASTSVAPPGFS